MTRIALWSILRPSPLMSADSMSRMTRVVDRLSAIRTSTESIEPSGATRTSTASTPRIMRRSSRISDADTAILRTR